VTRREWIERYGIDGRGLRALVNAYHALCQYEIVIQSAARDLGCVSGGGTVDTDGVTAAIEHLRVTYQDATPEAK